MAAGAADAPFLRVIMRPDDETGKATESEPPEPAPPGELDPVQEASEETFPASAAPGWEPLHIGGRPPG